MTSNLLLNDQQGKEVRCRCRNCKIETKQKIITDVSRRSYYELDDRDSAGWSEAYQIVQCGGCNILSFRRETASEDDSLHFEDGRTVYPVNVEIYPDPIQVRSFLNDVDLLPDKIQLIYQETVRALNNAQAVLCGIGVRAIVESVCEDKKANATNLRDQVNQLFSLGVLGRSGTEMLQQLRIMGNQAAHKVKPHTLRELALALDVVDNMLQGVYIWDEHARKKLPSSKGSFPIGEWQFVQSPVLQMKPQVATITLGVNDLQSALNFYRDGLGFATAGIVGQEFEPGAVVFIQLQAGLRLALWPRTSIAHETGLALGAASATEMTLGHTVSSKVAVDVLMAKASSAGAVIVKPAHDTLWGGYAGYFQDPDGHVWEVVCNPRS